jgi:hypothetical protein
MDAETALGRRHGLTSVKMTETAFRSFVVFGAEQSADFQQANLWKPLLAMMI